MTRIVLGLGSNINPQANLIAAADVLREEWPDMRFSSVYRSKAVGYANQDDFLNTVGIAQTDRDPHSVIGKLKQIEEALGKEIVFKNGPRTIDLDLLLYGEQQFSEPELTVPHPRMHERRFVLEPLCELIDENEMHPILKKTWRQLLEQVKSQECERTHIQL